MDLLADLYRRMVVIRQVEQTLAQLFAEGAIPGFLHLSIGQEAIAAGMGKALRPTDTVASTHRGHGHCVAKGMDLVAFFAELLGRQGGACKGRGGSMHVADMSIGMLGANGIVGAGLPIALGSALAHKVKGQDSIAVAFFGDGAQAEGALHETINLAKAFAVPLLLVCEDNGWSEFTPGDRAFMGSLDKLAGAFDMPFRQADGNEVSAVFEAATAMVESVRQTGKPAILRFLTQRVDGHFAGDPQRYRSDESRKLAADSDPIKACEVRLLAAGMKQRAIDEIGASVRDGVQRAMEEAQSSPAASLDFTKYAATSPMEAGRG